MSKTWKPFSSPITGDIINMLIRLILRMRQAGLPAGVHELLQLSAALEAGLAADRVTFYQLCKSICIKHENQLPRFEAIFEEVFAGEHTPEAKEIPDEWLRKELERLLSEEELAKLRAYGSIHELMERFQELMRKQQEKHQCGDTWIGTGGTSPFGAFGHNPAGFRIGQGYSRNKRAVKKLDTDQLPPDVEEEPLSTRHFQLALRRLRQLARDGRTLAFDLPETIRKTSRNAGLLDLHYSPTRQHHARLLVLLDWGGSMSTHARLCRQLVEAARAEFKDIRIYYFRNCLYEFLWTDPRRLPAHRVTTESVFAQFNANYRVLLIGDAQMAPSELHWPGGCLEHHNTESGISWLGRWQEHYPKSVWLNPESENNWRYSDTIFSIRELWDNRMFPFSLKGLKMAITALKK